MLTMPKCKCINCYHYDICGIKHYSDGSGYCNVFKDKSLIVELPCKVGDEVYSVRVDENHEDYIDMGKVYAISQNEDTLWFSVRYLNGLRYDHTSGDFGKIVFCTKGKAEQALKGGEEK